nr:Mov34/MPN/PAD-1 family protein [Paludisphaera mucosa]
MVFGEVRFREPARLKRPDRDARYACVACQTPGPDDLPVFLDPAPADAIERHALSDTSVELGGVLLGKECVDPASGRPFVWITRSLEAKHYANTQASFTYTHDSWEEITRERDRLHPDLDVVGWYHTHPNFGIFLSHHDLFIHQNFFSQPLQTAYVVDPIQGTRGFFQWADGRMVQVGGFHLCAERSERVALSRLADQMENLPGSSQGGSGLSPRLEAELIKMLSRPAPPVGGPGDRLALAVLLGFLGSLLFLLVATAGFWLSRVDGRLGEQGDALAALKLEVDESASGRKAAVDLLLEKVGGETPELFVERYEKLARARDDARKQLVAQQSVNEALGLRVKDLTSAAGSLGAELDAARKTLAEYEADAKAAPKLRERIAVLESEAAENLREIKDQRAILATKEGENAAATYNSLKVYTLTTYAAGLAALLMGLTAVFFYYRSLAPPPETSHAASRRAP